MQGGALALLLVLSLGASACTGVKPWERDQLGRPEMGWAPNEHESAFEGHVFFSKEGSTLGGSDAGGGGCGCN
jgi:hypothetical protein